MEYEYDNYDYILYFQMIYPGHVKLTEKEVKLPHISVKSNRPGFLVEIAFNFYILKIVI